VDKTFGDSDAVERRSLFNEVGVKLDNFWITLCDPNAFITHSMLMPVLEDLDQYFSAIELLQNSLDITKPFVSTLRCCICFEMFEISPFNVI